MMIRTLFVGKGYAKEYWKDLDSDLKKDGLGNRQHLCSTQPVLRVD